MTIHDLSQIFEAFLVRRDCALRRAARFCPISSGSITRSRRMATAHMHNIAGRLRPGTMAAVLAVAFSVNGCGSMAAGGSAAASSGDLGLIEDAMRQVEQS